MSDQYLGEIRLFPFNFAPVGWATCSGQILPLSQYTALFSLLGTNYGGDGKSNFGLPNLQGQVVVGQGQGPGLSPYFVGESGGEATVALTSSEMANHTHSLNTAAVQGTANVSAGNELAITLKSGHQGAKTANSYSTNPPNATMAPGVLNQTGGNQPHNNLQPYLAMTYCIAMQGVYPPRN